MKGKKKLEDKKAVLKVRQTTCFVKVNLSREEDGYSFHFIPSGFEKMWLKVWECYDYTVGVDYASAEENEILNKEKGSIK